VQRSWRATCQSHPNASQQKPALIDHLIGAQQDGFRYFEPERLGSAQVDDEIELGRLLDRDVAWLRPAQLPVFGQTSALCLFAKTILSAPRMLHVVSVRKTGAVPAFGPSP
jgi:hypothetical protein